MIKKILVFLLIFLSLSLYSNSMDKNIRILNYNIYRGMSCDTSTDKETFVEWISNISPDIVSLQEVNNFTQVQLENLASKYNHPYAILLKETGYPVALTSKYPIVNVQKVIDNMHHGYIIAQILDYYVLVTHLSPHKWKKREQEINLILSAIRSTAPKGKWIVMGDFNSFSPLDASAYSNGELKERTNMLEKKYKSHQNLKNGELDFSVIQKVLDEGFYDALKQKHVEFVPTVPTKVLEHSYLNINPSFRIDYIFVSKVLRNKIKKCDVIKTAFTDNYSDHYPVLLDLSE